MKTTIDDMVRVEMALVEGWSTSVLHLYRAWQHMAVANLTLLTHPALHRVHNVLPSGADWTDHYGKRSHDVDIEHLR